MRWLVRTVFYLRGRFNLRGRAGLYFYAILAGAFAALVAMCFQAATKWILFALTSSGAGRIVASFAEVEPWRRVMSLSIGGLVAGLILLYASKKIRNRATPYMEALSIGDGYIPVRANLLRSLAAIVTIGSGASIGREGPLVQTAAVFASAFGRRIRMSMPRLRLFIACATSGALAAVFHTPLAGGLFVCEIVIGVMAIDMLAPLLVASCASYLTMMALVDTSPLYEFAAAHIDMDLSMAAYAAILGICASLLANLWLILLSKMRSALNGKAEWLPLRLVAAGVGVGIISVWYPEVVGNGAHIIRGIVSMNFTPDTILLLLFLKVFSVALFFGMGAVGGVLTPSLTIGGISGFLFAHVLLAMGVPLGEEEIIGFSLLGMASFFTTAAAAPVTSLILVIEFTMAGRLIFPLIIGVLASYGMSKVLATKSMYAASAAKGIKTAFNMPLKDVKIGDIFRKTSDTVSSTTLFAQIAKIFIKKPEYAVYVVSRSGRYAGAILQRDVLGFMRSNVLLGNVIADDIMRTDIPALRPEMSLLEGIGVFAEHMECESLPIVSKDKKFYGVVNRSDIFMGFNEIAMRDKLLV